MSIPGAASPLFLGAAVGAEAAAYQIDRSLRFNSADSAHLSRTPSSAGNRKTWTWSGWVKKSSIDNSNGRDIFAAGLNLTNDSTYFELRFGTGAYKNSLAIGGFSTNWRITDQVFRDPSAWYHIVVAVDTTQTTGSDRVKIYVNGEQITSFVSSSDPALNADTGVNNTSEHVIGKGTYDYFDGYLTDVHFIDGQALAPTDFGEYDSNNVWQPKEFSGSYSIDYSSHATNPSSFNGSAANLFDGDLTTGWQNTDTSGSTYASVDLTQGGATSGIAFTTSFEMYGAFSYNQVLEIDHAGGTHTYNGNPGGSGAWIDFASSLTSPVTAVRFKDSGGTGTPSWNAIRADGSILVDGGDNSFRLDFSDNSSDQALGYDAAVTAPTLNPRGGMDVITYTGNGSTQTIGGLAFQPDFLWIKSRNGSNKYHTLADSVRGKGSNGAYLRLFSNTTSAELDDGYDVTDITSDGFSLTNGSYSNTSSENYVAWAWKAGGPAELNEDGSIDSQVSVSTDYGFSIVTCTTPASNTFTVGHGLNATPKLIILRARNQSYNWDVYHESIGATKRLILNLNNAEETQSGVWNNTAPTSTVFSSSGNGVWYGTGDTLVAYCWSEVSGFSKFGSYTGNGSSSGPQVTTGFKPRWLLVKEASGADDWQIIDSARSPSNPIDDQLYANLSDAEYNTSNRAVDFVSNGFDIKGNNAGLNQSGATYVYAAFADRPGNNWTTNNLIAEAGLETASQGFDVVTYSGNSSTQNITGLDFQPDLVWIKTRNDNSYHFLTDSVRGVNKHLASNATDAEGNVTAVTAFNSDGFSLANQANVNDSAYNYVAWCWKAGGTASSNDSGSITSSVSANQTYGFSIVSFVGTGANGSIGHGLNAAPKFIIAKNRDSADNWFIYHSAIGANGYIMLNQTSAADTSNSTVWQNVAPTSSVFSASTGGYNDSGDNIIAYCWSEVPGFSKFGSYTGNGSTTGPVVTLGFKPRFILVRSTSSNRGWVIWDTARDTNTTNDNNLFPNNTSAESSSSDHNLIIRDDGFQLATTSVNRNGSGETYIYAAFAGKPPGEIIDSLIDTPTNYEASSGNNGGNYCTWNPLKNTNGAHSEGNLKFVGNSNWCHSPGTFLLSSGKWYFEGTYKGGSFGSNQGNIATGIGFIRADAALGEGSNQEPVNSADFRSNTLAFYQNGYFTNLSTHSSVRTQISEGDVVGVSINFDAGTYAFYVNNSSVASGSLSYTGPFLPWTHVYYNNSFYDCNFGQRPFAYTPPSGHLAVVTTNLTDPTIADGSTVFDVRSGLTAQFTISDLNFAADLVVAKSTSNSEYWIVADVVRSFIGGLRFNDTNAEGSGNAITNVGATGYQSDSNWFTTGRTYVTYNWDAGSSTVTNTDGSITSQVRANPSAGFSIVSYTGPGSSATIGHGLNAAPEFIIAKNRDYTDPWAIYHVATGANKLVYLDTSAASSVTGYWGSGPTSSVFGIGNYGGVARSGNDFIAYCFAPVAGYSSFGSYTGNGSSDGPFVYTGFRPKFIIVKISSTTGNWIMYDTSRDTYNIVSAKLYPNSNIAEDSSVGIYDFLSNGFKARHTGATNTSGATYVWAAFAENPFKTARAR